MCEFCNDNKVKLRESKDLSVDKEMGMQIAHKLGEYFLLFGDRKSHTDKFESVAIHYCPICGNKLGRGK